MAASSTTLPLSSIYPINTLMELTLNNSKEITTGTIYCTDEVSNTIVLKNSLVHTTLSSEIRVINADVVTGRRIIKEKTGDNNWSSSSSSEAVAGGRGGEEEAAENYEDKIISLPIVSRRMVEERERRAIKLMEESFSHVNQQVRDDFVCCYYYLQFRVVTGLVLSSFFISDSLS